LYKQCSDQYAANEGKLPVLNYVKSEAKKIGQGNTRIPRFEIVSWIAQPAGMYQSDAEYTAQVAAPPAPVPKAVAAPAPAPQKSAMAQAVEDDEMF
jgi:alpha/beta superfamily hydrolase